MPEEGSNRPLRRSTKFGYGFAELGIVSAEVLLELYLLKFYNVVVGLPSLYTALALGIALLWDAISDPLMGEISDRTQNSAGRRRAYFLPGALALGIALVVIFNPPSVSSFVFKFLYLLWAYLFLTTAMTVLSVPHLALAGELSFDRNERTEIFGFRRLFTTAGLLMGTLLPMLVLRWFGGEESIEAVARSRSFASIFLAGIILATTWVTTRSTRGLDRTHSSAVAPLSVRTALSAQLGACRNRVFQPLLAAFVIAGVGRALNASLALYYYEYRLLLSESQTVLRILFPFFISILASIPFWLWISRRHGKKRPAFWGVLGLGVLVSFAYPILPPGAILPPLAIAILGGSLSGSIILFESLVADVVDVDELQTGRNREGLYFGMWKMGTKLSRALGLLLAGALLHVIEFEGGADVQSAEAIQRLSWIFGPGVGGLLIIGAMFFLWFPLGDAQHRRIQQLLRQSRQGRTLSEDDLDGAL